MKLTDVLKLEKKPESLNVIQAFLNQSLPYNEYIIASSYYLEIANELALHDLVLIQGTKVLDKFQNQLPTDYHEKIYKHLINSSLKLEKFDEAKTYIEKRRNVLNIMDQYLSLIDELEYKKALNEDIYDTLRQLVIESTPHNTQTFALEELLKYYVKKEQLEDALLTIEQLKEHTNSNEYKVEQLNVLYKMGKYSKSILLAKDILSKNYNCPLAASIIISSYTNEGKLQKASTLEAEYEDVIDNAPVDIKTFAYEEIVKLYEMMNNPISLKLYKDKLRKLKKTIKKSNKPLLSNTKLNAETKEITVKVINQDKKSISKLKHLEHFSWLKKWLIQSHQLDQNMPLREYLRKLLTIINEKVNFTEVILYDEKNIESNFYNFKKNRLYDKKIITPYIDNTIIAETLNQKDHLFGNVKTLRWQKDVLTQKQYDDSVKYIYSYYIDEGLTITFYINEEIEDASLYYDLYEGISTIIHTKLLDNIICESMRNETNFLNSIIDKSLIPIRILTETRSTYNKAATHFFQIHNHEHLELFLRDVPIVDAKLYNDTIKRLFNYPNETKIITYKYQDKSITEYLYAIKKSGIVNIISFFIDITTSKTKQAELTKKATIDNETNLLNKYQLTKDLDHLLKSKVTFMLIELDQNLRHIYGNEKLNEYFIEFSKATNIHFKDQLVYRYGFNQLLIVIDNNDIRTIDKIIKDYYMVAIHLKSKVLKYEKYKFHTGILRYPVVTVEKDYNKLFRYLDVALQKAKTNRNNDFVYFIHSDYEKEVFEQQVIDYLNIAIENKQLSLVFNQIIDIENNRIWQYESELVLPTINVDKKYLNIIAKKRNRIVDLEYYHLEAVCQFLQQLEKETNRLIKLTIPISEETFLSPDFQGFLIGTLKTYKIPADFIRIVCDVDIKDQSNALKVEEIISYGISLDTTYLDTALSHNFHAVHLNFKDRNLKWRNYYKTINKFLNDNHIALILKNVNTKEDRTLVKQLGINYISGNLYQRLDTVNLIQKIKDVN